MLFDWADEVFVADGFAILDLAPLELLPMVLTAQFFILAPTVLFLPSAALSELATQMTDNG